MIPSSCDRAGRLIFLDPGRKIEPEWKEIDGKDKGKGMKKKGEENNFILPKSEETFRVILNALSRRSIRPVDLAILLAEDNPRRETKDDAQH